MAPVRPWLRCCALLPTALLSVSGVLVSETRASAADLVFPTQGVICDPGGQPICYDRRGASVAQTRTYYGLLAAQALMRNLNGQPPSTQFLLSNGSRCDVNLASCWLPGGGWGNPQPDRRLTAQLFGGGGGGYIPPSPQPGPYPNPSPIPGPGPVNSQGYCRLSRGFTTLYNGNCDIRRTESNQRGHVVVTLGNGASYGFDHRNGRVTVGDGSGGRWPVTVSNQGNTAVFRWQDLALTATLRNGANRPGVGQALGQLLESLLFNNGVRSNPAP